MTQSPVQNLSPTEAQQPFQFGLRALLVAIACVAIVLAVTSQWNIVAGCLAGAIACCLAPLALGRAWAGWMTAGFVLFVLAGLLSPALQTPRRRTRPVCATHLKQIGFALHNYHDIYGCLPPAYIADANGRPMHSWRVLILPFLGQQQLYAQYRFDEPWNGPNNRLLHKLAPDVYRCPRSTNPPGTTDYLAIVGQDTAWPPVGGVTFASFTDGTSQTILVVEAAAANVIWCEPRDLEHAAMPRQISSTGGRGMSSGHSTGAHVLLGDGSVQFLESTISPEQLRALITPHGGEAITW